MLDKTFPHFRVHTARKGTVVFLNKIIKEAGNVMHEQMQKNEGKYNAVVDPEETALEIGITGVKIQDMAAKRCASSPYTSALLY